MGRLPEQNAIGKEPLKPVNPYPFFVFRYRPGQPETPSRAHDPDIQPISLSPFIPKLPTSLQKQLEIDFGFQG